MSDTFEEYQGWVNAPTWDTYTFLTNEDVTRARLEELVHQASGEQKQIESLLRWFSTQMDEFCHLSQFSSSLRRITFSCEYCGSACKARLNITQEKESCSITFPDQVEAFFRYRARSKHTQFCTIIFHLACHKWLDRQLYTAQHNFSSLQGKGRLSGLDREKMSIMLHGKFMLQSVPILHFKYYNALKRYSSNRKRIASNDKFLKGHVSSRHRAAIHTLFGHWVTDPERHIDWLVVYDVLQGSTSLSQESLDKTLVEILQMTDWRDIVAHGLGGADESLRSWCADQCLVWVDNPESRRHPGPFSVLPQALLSHYSEAVVWEDVARAIRGE